MAEYTLNFDQISMNDVALVGGKNASLGEMFRQLTPSGINVPDGFATTSKAYLKLLRDNQAEEKISAALAELDTKEYTNLRAVGANVREIILHCTLPEELKKDITDAYNRLKEKYNEDLQVAVRSSATAEDLPSASFAGQQESFLNVRNLDELLDACMKCYASLFTDRAIKYRNDNGFPHMEVQLSIGVQKMVRSDRASAGVCFTIDPETGFEDVIYISGGWGLGENIVKGEINPDEFLVFKPALERGKRAVISVKIGSKSKTMVYSEQGSKESTINIDTPAEKQVIPVLSEKEIEQLGRWAKEIEEHYGMPMDIEWAKDGISGDLCIVQARPETVHSNLEETSIFREFTLKSKGPVLARGNNVGTKITAGKARILTSTDQIDQLQKGEILVTEITNPDWDPILKKASAIVTDKGGRTSHAAIVARESGAVAVVGTGDATSKIRDGQEVTVSCIDGKQGVVYEGILEWDEKEIDISKIGVPETEVMFILADPDQAFKMSFLPNSGVGLMRIEFAISNNIGIHPMALVNYGYLEDKKAESKIAEITQGYEDKKEFFVDKLSHAVATIAAAFYPKDVIVRMSDFKSNEYANLIGGHEFEPHEENPMIGWRGASRYYSDSYRPGFELECKAMRRVRDEMGFENVKLMIPFCRTVEEGEKVVDLMHQQGLRRGENGLEIYVMIEIPSNVILAEEFAKVFDGFSIGSNDLTQLTLGIDRDSEILSELFDVNNKAIKSMISKVIKSANKTNTKIGLCGQAPSDFPEFAGFLVEQGINSISFNPDALLKGMKNINAAETKRSAVRTS